MKKIAFIIGMACMVMSMSAQTITGRSRIILSTAGETDKDVRLLLSSSFSNSWDNTWDANPAQDGGIYVYYQGAKYSIWASNEYSNDLALGFVATSNTSYRLTFGSFLNTPYTITDLKENHVIAVNSSITVDGNPATYYDFNIDDSEKNTAINDRFVINYVAPAPLVKGICFNYNILTLTKYAGETVEVYNYGTTTAAMAPVAIAADAATDVDLSALASGKYLVKIGTEEYVIDVKPAVTVVP